jgi:TatD DNase family protein
LDLFVDTHCHLNFNSYQDDLADVLNRARQQGIGRILVPGTNLETSRRAVELASLYPDIYAAVGIHPGDVMTWDKATLHELERLSQSHKVVAIGEIGLDYYRDQLHHQQQLEIFKAQLEMASQKSLPVIIHNRKATTDLLPALIEWQQRLVQEENNLSSHPGVLHSYEGDVEVANRAIQYNFKIGITGPVTFKNALEHQKVISKIPVTELLLETDAPFLAPHPNRGRRNEPAFVIFIAEKIAALHQMSLAEIAIITTKNADWLFKWGIPD